MSSQTSVNDFAKEVVSAYKALMKAGLAISALQGLEQHTGSDGVTELRANWSIGDLKSGINKHVPYRQVYEECLDGETFNFKLIDGALIQLWYEFSGKRKLIRSAQRFLPCPDLTPYIEDDELYVADVPFAEVATQRTVTVPLRFDFDCRKEVIRDGHPASHLTLGEYPNCRIPTTHPLTPAQFLEFILNAFYCTTPEHSWSGGTLGASVGPLSRYISLSEQKRVHITVGN